LFDKNCKYDAYVKKILDYGRAPIPVVIAELFEPSSTVGRSIVVRTTPRVEPTKPPSVMQSSIGDETRNQIVNSKFILGVIAFLLVVIVLLVLQRRPY
jgi:hypothetical protein